MEQKGREAARVARNNDRRLAGGSCRSVVGRTRMAGPYRDLVSDEGNFSTDLATGNMQSTMSGPT